MSAQPRNVFAHTVVAEAQVTARCLKACSAQVETLHAEHVHSETVNTDTLTATTVSTDVVNADTVNADAVTTSQSLHTGPIVTVDVQQLRVIPLESPEAFALTFAQRFGTDTSGRVQFAFQPQFQVVDGLFRLTLPVPFETPYTNDLPPTVTVTPAQFERVDGGNLPGDIYQVNLYVDGVTNDGFVVHYDLVSRKQPVVPLESLVGGQREVYYQVIA